MVALFSRVFFGTSATTSSTSAVYESLAPEVNAVLIFNQMDAITHEKDNFFHQTGKIYTITGDTLFHRYDTMFHILDNAYHRSIDTKEKLKRAQQLEKFIKAQNELFTSTTYINAEQEKRFETLDQQFLQILGEMEGKNTMTGDNKTLTGTIIAQ